MGNTFAGGAPNGTVSPFSLDDDDPNAPPAASNPVTAAPDTSSLPLAPVPSLGNPSPQQVAGTGVSTASPTNRAAFTALKNFGSAFSKTLNDYGNQRNRTRQPFMYGQ